MNEEEIVEPAAKFFKSGLVWIFLVFVIFFVATVLINALWLSHEESVEFASSQEAADSITDFYSVVLDRSDITEGEFTLDIAPGNLIAFELDELPEMDQSLRTANLSDDGTSVTVRTKLGISVAELLDESVTSTLLIDLKDGESELEVPVSIRFNVGPRFSVVETDSSEAQALLELRNEGGPYRYEFRVTGSTLDSGVYDGSYLRSSPDVRVWAIPYLPETARFYHQYPRVRHIDMSEEEILLKTVGEKVFTVPLRLVSINGVKFGG